jgi:hypothetical protein
VLSLPTFTLLRRSAASHLNDFPGQSQAQSLTLGNGDATSQFEIGVAPLSSSDILSITIKANCRQQEAYASPRPIY